MLASFRPSFQRFIAIRQRLLNRHLYYKFESLYVLMLLSLFPRGSAACLDLQAPARGGWKDFRNRGLAELLTIG